MPFYLDRYTRDLRGATEEALDKIIQRVLRRSEAWDTRVLAHFSNAWGTRGVRTVLGTFSHTYFDRHGEFNGEREIIAHSAIPVMPDGYETPSTLARDYLFTRYFRRRPRRFKAQEGALANAMMPSYARPTTFEHGYYVDVIRAWWMVMLISGWDVEYYPNRWLSFGRPPFDFPFPAEKVARSSIVSVARPGSSVRVFDPKKIPTIQGVTAAQIADDPILAVLTEQRYNILRNEGVFALIADVLSALAHEAQRTLGPELVYWYTDGAIVTSAEACARLIQLVRGWGLDATIKAEGLGWVAGRGSYRVGEMASQVRMKPRSFTQQQSDGLLLPTGASEAWLRRQWQGVLRQHGLGANESIADLLAVEAPALLGKRLAAPKPAPEAGPEPAHDPPPVTGPEPAAANAPTDSIDEAPPYE